MRIKSKRREHSFGDLGQFILLGIFLTVSVGESFYLHQSIFLSESFPLTIRLVILGLAFITAIYLFKSGHVVVNNGKGPTILATQGAFRYVRHPLYLASLLTYFGLTISTASLFIFCPFCGGFLYSTITSQAMKNNCFWQNMERRIEITGEDPESGYRERTHH